MNCEWLCHRASVARPSLEQTTEFRACSWSRRRRRVSDGSSSTCSATPRLRYASNQRGVAGSSNSLADGVKVVGSNPPGRTSPVEHLRPSLQRSASREFVGGLQRSPQRARRREDERFLNATPDPANDARTNHRAAVRANATLDRTAGDRDRTTGHRHRTTGHRERTTGDRDRRSGDRDRTIGDRDWAIGDRAPGDRTTGDRVRERRTEAIRKSAGSSPTLSPGEPRRLAPSRLIKPSRYSCAPLIAEWPEESPLKWEPRAQLPPRIPTLRAESDAGDMASPSVQDLVSRDYLSANGCTCENSRDMSCSSDDPGRGRGLKSAMKKSGDESSLSVSRGVVITGPVMDKRSVTDNTRPPRSFWESATSEQSEGGDAVYVGPDTRFSSVVYVPPEAPVRPVKKEIKEKNYTPTASMSGVIPQTVGHSQPSPDMSSPHQFTYPRKLPLGDSDPSETLMPMDNIRTLDKLDHSPFYKACAPILKKSEGFDELNDILLLAGDNLTKDGLKVDRIHMDSLEKHTMYLSEDCKNLVIKKENMSEGRLIQLDQLTSTYTWLEILQNPRFHERMADPIFGKLNEQQLRSTVIVQHKFGMFIKTEWFIAQSPQDALALHVLCNALYTYLTK